MQTDSFKNPTREGRMSPHAFGSNPPSRKQDEAPKPAVVATLLPPGSSTDARQGEEYGWLNELEALFVCMLVGIRRVVLERFPRWLAEFFRGAIRISIKLARVSMYATAWGGITFGPAAASWIGIPGRSGLWMALAAVVWTAFALFGSAWGLAYVRRKRRS